MQMTRVNAPAVMGAVTETRRSGEASQGGLRTETWRLVGGREETGGAVRGPACRGRRRKEGGTEDGQEAAGAGASEREKVDDRERAEWTGRAWQLRVFADVPLRALGSHGGSDRGRAQLHCNFRSPHFTAWFLWKDNGAQQGSGPTGTGDRGWTERPAGLFCMPGISCHVSTPECGI